MDIEVDKRIGKVVSRWADGQMNALGKLWKKPDQFRKLQFDYHLRLQMTMTFGSLVNSYASTAGFHFPSHSSCNRLPR